VVETQASQITREERIPLFTRVDTSAAQALGAMYTWNISGGGVYLRAPHAAANDIPIGSDIALDFALPDGSPRMKLSARVVWIDPSVRDHQGESVVGIGARFSGVPSEIEAQLHNFIKAFRYKVVTLGFADLDLAKDAFGDLFELAPAASEEALREAISSGQTGLVLIGQNDGSIPKLKRLVEDRALAHAPPILVIGKTLSAELEALLVKNENITYIEPPLTRWVLRSIVQRAVEGHVLSFQNQLLTEELSRAIERLRRENYRLRQAVPETIDGIIGSSDAMRQVFDMIERVAPFSTSVMIAGETGTGKELVARAIHKRSPRAEQPFIAQNCAAFAENLLDSELFGHTRGAFTGATHDRAGIFEAASGGTVFLDEVGEMTPTMQAKVLRVLQDGELRRVGDVTTRKVDVRVIAATHRNLEQMVKDGKFREDLYYRLRAFTLTLPPLSKRRDDIPLLALHFLDKLAERHGTKATITADAMRVLESHAWPGNVRELENTIEQLLVMTGSENKIDAPLVRETLGVEASSGERQGRSLNEALDDYERSLLRAELEKAGGIITRAALTLGLDRSTLSKRCKRLGLTMRAKSVEPGATTSS
jgi:DNA-binding NtrC family response regulator/Tfp pilus assembly protein PilZ